MFDDKFLHHDIYISYKDTTIVVLCSEKEEMLSLETDGPKELWYYRVNKEKFDILVAKLLNKDIGNNHKKDSKYFQLYSRSNLMKVFEILDYREYNDKWENFLNWKSEIHGL